MAYIKNLLIALLFMTQIVLCSCFYGRHEEAMPNPPKIQTAKILAMGDYHTYFRVMSLRLQNIGDSWGRFMPLSKYDYKKLVWWLSVMDELDSRSDFTPAIAGCYYGATANKADVALIVDYLVQRSMKNLNRDWWWMMQAIMLANDNLKDKELASRLAGILSEEANMPTWAGQLSEILLYDIDFNDKASQIIDVVVRKKPEISSNSLKNIKYFIHHRVNKGLDIR